jgi:hypothetical protein
MTPTDAKQCCLYSELPIISETHQTHTRPYKPSQRLLHLRDVQLDMRDHFQELVMRVVYFILDVLLEIHHLSRISVLRR